jgi:tripartite-type tricarboxylate transporter receptor subunit TctC
MNYFSRRRFLHLATGAVVLRATPRTARAQTYPWKPVRIIAGYPAGGTTDILARLIGQWLSERLGQSFIVENRAGAGGTIAVDSVVRAPSDGYTLLLTATNDAYSEYLYPDLKYNYVRDIAPVASISLIPAVLEVNQSVPVKTLPDFVAYAKANPGKLNMGSGGIGTPDHLAGELFKTMVGANMIHVPYRGAAPAIADLIAGQVQVMFGTSLDRADQSWEPAGARGNHRKSLGGVDGYSGLERICTGLRGKHLVWRWRTKEHARRGHQQPEQGD